MGSSTNWRDAGAVERGGLENRCPAYAGPRVRIPVSPPTPPAQSLHLQAFVFLIAQN